MVQAFQTFGFQPFIPVAEQASPDPEFPTVKFPNPEEKGIASKSARMKQTDFLAFCFLNFRRTGMHESQTAVDPLTFLQDLAIAEAQCQGADYVLAQDPDSDRFSAVERGLVIHRTTQDWELTVIFPSPSGAWISFTGDQLGVLFASKILEDFKMSGKSLGTISESCAGPRLMCSPDKLAIVASTVSSKMVEAMAETEGFRFAECLTGIHEQWPHRNCTMKRYPAGFKFIGNTALNLTGQGYEVPFGYEEAIGYMFGDQIRDKDGVAASVRWHVLGTLCVRAESLAYWPRWYLQNS